MSSNTLKRRGVLGLTAGLVLSATTALAVNTAPAQAVLPGVNMEYVVVQAQVEPVRGQTGLAGNDSVRLVQSALKAKGFTTAVDGWYGNGTTSAYSAWQRRLGYSGLGANGLPGPTSLTKLGTNRYTVNHVISIGGRTTYSGKTVNQRTRNMLASADAKVPFAIRLTQGSYNPGGVGASAGTHDGGGAVDVNIDGLTQTQVWRTVAALRTVGFAAWYRPTTSDWHRHIHAIAIGDTDLPSSARNQVADYYAGKNGLASHAADNTPSAYRRAFTWYEKYKRS